MTQVSPVLTASEVAERLRVSTETVHQWTRIGRLPVITLPSGRKRFRLADIEALEAA